MTEHDYLKLSNYLLGSTQRNDDKHPLISNGISQDQIMLEPRPDWSPLRIFRQASFDLFISGSPRGLFEINSTQSLFRYHRL